MLDLVRRRFVALSRNVLAGLFAMLVLIASGEALATAAAPVTESEAIEFAVLVETPAQLGGVRILVESLPTFGGRLANSPFWVYCPDAVIASQAPELETLAALGAELRSTAAAAEPAWYPLAGWPATAARAESDAAGRVAVLAWLGPDTVILQEPSELLLPPGSSLGYRPVFHRNICPRVDEPLDTYWTRAYEVMGVDPSPGLSMVTPADDDVIRPYFQAGCLVVRPDRAILRTWAKTFTGLSGDSAIRAMCEADQRRRIFTFQVALVGAILTHIGRDEMIELSDRVNYPIFFKEMFGAKHDFHDITQATTIRYEHFFVDPPDGWDAVLTGPRDRIVWLAEKFGRTAR